MDNEMMISGKWFNKNTGDVVNVVNNVIDGDEMIVITDKGPIKLQDFSEYMQMSDEIYDERGKVIGTEQVNYSDIIQQAPQISIKETKKTVISNNQEKNNNLDFDDSTFISVPEPVITKPTIKKEQQVSNNEHIISKFFDKIQNKDELIDIKINTSILPISDLKTITTYMDVSYEEIATYIVEKLIDKTYLKTLIHKILTDILEAD